MFFRIAENKTKQNKKSLHNICIKCVKISETNLLVALLPKYLLRKWSGYDNRNYTAQNN